MRSASAPERPNSALLDITVILCTYNRCTDLAGVLETIARSEIANSIAWEVLVVDNNSTDQTCEIVEQFCQKYPGLFHYLFEPTPGKSYALNAGVAKARGRVLAFVDDDVSVEPSWLQNLTKELLREPSWAGSGGRTLAAEKFTLPPWLPPGSLPIVYPHFDLGDQPTRMSCAPYGSNMAFQKHMFGRYGGFRTDLGPSPKSDIPRPNEDTEFGRRLLAAGERLRYEPSAVVYHPVPKARITKEYFLSWWFDYGRALIRERGDRPDVYGIPWDYLSLVSRFAQISAHTLIGSVLRGSSKRFAHKCEVWKNKGQIAELRRRSIQRRMGKAADAVIRAER